LQAIADFRKSKALADAKDAVARQLAEWEKKTGLALKPRTHFAEAVLHAEVRAHFAAMRKRHNRTLFSNSTPPIRELRPPFSVPHHS
jgi:hypothetical protein